jgi:hypothetical protein
MAKKRSVSTEADVETPEIHAPTSAKQEIKATPKQISHPGFKAHLFQKAFDHLTEDEMEAVEINVDVPIAINGEKFSGLCIVPRHVAQTIVPMVQSKIRADISIFTDRSLVIKEGRL